MLKSKLIAIINYCFKQELHELLWFNDNDKDNINFLSASGHATSDSTTFGTSEFVPVAGYSASGHSARNLVLLNLVLINLVLLNLVHLMVFLDQVLPHLIFLHLLFFTWPSAPGSLESGPFSSGPSAPSLPSPDPSAPGSLEFHLVLLNLDLIYTLFNIDIEEEFSQCHPHRL